MSCLSGYGDLKSGPLAVETLCSDDTKFLVEFIVTGKAYEKTVNGDTRIYLPVMFDKPVFKGGTVKNGSD